MKMDRASQISGGENLDTMVELNALEPQSASRGSPSGFRFTSNIVGFLSLVTDISCFAISAPIALFLYSMVRGAEVVIEVHFFAFVLTLASFLLIRSSRNAYRRSLVDLKENSDASFDAIVSSLIASALIWQAGLVEDYSRGTTLLFLITLLVCLASSRPLLHRVFRRLAARGLIQQRLAFYGADASSLALMQQLLQTLDFPHLRVIGVADDRTREPFIEGLTVLGDLAALRELARRGEVDQVLISGSHFSPKRLQEIVESLSEVCVDVSLIPAQAIELASKYSVNLLGSIPVLTLWQRPFRDLSQVAKRAEDLILGGLALILLSPLLLLAAIGVALSGPGPIIFVQPRFGFNNQTIHVFKFRTMHSSMTDLRARNTTTKDDPRITWIGRYLRRFSIDELPQLFNVILGNMSLVGPRPHGTEMMVGDQFYHKAVAGYMGRHRVKPGITGYAQVKGLRGEVRTMERAKRRVELDTYYLENWSLWLDLWILLATGRAVLFDRDAY
jgi:Undecaprenyl-phosphate glucose phosphotransferase